jgi:hypothetical protein
MRLPKTARLKEPEVAVNPAPLEYTDEMQRWSLVRAVIETVRNSQEGGPGAYEMWKAEAEAAAEAVARHMGKKASWGRRWWDEWVKTCRVDDTPGKGARTDRAQDWEVLEEMLHVLLAEPLTERAGTWTHLTRQCREMTKGMGIEPFTRKVVTARAKSMMYSIRRPKQEDLLSKKQQQARQQFGELNLTRSMAAWRRVVFSDSKIYTSDAPSSLTRKARPTATRPNQVALGEGERGGWFESASGPISHLRNFFFFGPAEPLEAFCTRFLSLVVSTRPVRGRDPSPSSASRAKSCPSTGCPRPPDSAATCTGL